MKSSLRQKQVKELVTQFPSLLEDYSSNKLVAAFWQHIEGARTINDAANCASPEAITRAFRHLITAGEIALPQHIKERSNQYQEEFKLEYTPV